jgi:hypothetical protein
MSKAFDTINHNILINKIINTTIPTTYKKYLANYLKGRQGYTEYNNTASKKRIIKTGVPQGSVLSPALFNLYLSDPPETPPGITLTGYADDLTPTSTHTNITTAENNMQHYLNSLNTWLNTNKLTLNPDKSTHTIFTTHPQEYNKTLNLQINNTKIPHTHHPKILGLTFDSKLNFGEHINKTKDNAQSTLNILKSLTSNKWGQNKETLTTTYKTITRPILEYASSIWSPLVSDTNTQKLQTIQNAALRTITGCTRDTNSQHLHEETKIIPIKEHLNLLEIQYHNKTLNQNHPLHTLNIHSPNKRNIRPSIFNSSYNNPNLENYDPSLFDHNKIRNLNTEAHTAAVDLYLNARDLNKILKTPAPPIHQSETSLDRHTRTTLSQLRTNKSPLLYQYLHK